MLEHVRTSLHFWFGSDLQMWISHVSGVWIKTLECYWGESGSATCLCDEATKPLPFVAVVICCMGNLRNSWMCWLSFTYKYKWAPFPTWGAWRCSWFEAKNGCPSTCTPVVTFGTLGLGILLDWLNGMIFMVLNLMIMTMVYGCFFFSRSWLGN